MLTIKLFLQLIVPHLISLGILPALGGTQPTKEY